MFDQGSSSAVPEPRSSPTPDSAVAPGGGVNEPLDTFSDEVLARQITSLAAHIYAATCRWLLLVAEFDRRQAWVESGCTSCAHWLSWRCAIGPGPAREHVRVARRLSEMPKITVCFARGELSYSKVRALSRIASPDNEDELLSWARHGTAAQIETLVRSYRRAKRVEELAEVNARHSQRFLNYFYDDDGFLIVNARLAPEDGAVVVAALEAAAEALDDTSDVAAEMPDESPPTVMSETAGVSAETPDERSPVGVSDAGDVSAKTPDPSQEITSDPPRSPARRADALVAIAETVLTTAIDRSPSAAERHQVVVHVDGGVLTDDSEESMCELGDGEALAPETARRLSCDASIITLLEREGAPVSVGRKTRATPPALRRALKSRDRHCRFPGCDRTRFVDAHHIRFWGRDRGETSLDNLVLLCRAHHRFLHEGGYSMKGTGADAIFMAPNGAPIEPQDDLPPLDEFDAPRLNVGLDIDDETCVPRWSGESLDHALAVEILLWFERNRSSSQAIGVG